VCLSGLWPRLIKTFSTAHDDDGAGGGGEVFENIQIQTQQMSYGAQLV